MKKCLSVIFFVFVFACSDEKEPALLDGSTSGDQDVVTIAPEQVADKVVRTKLGKLVRIARHVDTPGNAAIMTTVLGDVVEVPTVPANGICNVVVEAPSIDAKVFYGDSERASMEVPNIPALKNAFGKASWPVMIPDSQASGKWLWNVLLRGDDCTKAADDPNFVGSTMREFLTLPDSYKRRLVRTRGTCDVDGKQVECTVPWGDSRAVPGSRMFVPHGWAGSEHDLNYVGVTSGVYEERTSIDESKLTGVTK